MTNQADSLLRQLIQVASFVADNLGLGHIPLNLCDNSPDGAPIRSELEIMQEAARPFSLQQASVFLAVLIVSILSPFVDAQVRLCVLLLAVTFNTWYGGPRQGTMAAVFSAIVILANSLAMSHSIRIDPMQGLRLGVFLVSCYLLNRFAMSHRLAEALRSRNEEWNRKLVETAREGFWVFDNEWRTTYVNNRLAEMLGYAPRELLGEDFREFLVDGFRIRSAQDLTRRDHEHSDQQDLRFRRSDGSRLWATVTTSPVTNDRGVVVGLLAVVEDVTERKRAERDLDKALRAFQISEHAAWSPGRDPISSGSLPRTSRVMSSRRTTRS